MPTDDGPVRHLLDFTSLLRSSGLPVGSGDTLTFVSAVSVLDPGQIEDVYWAGRTTLVRRREQIPLYDECFSRHFLGATGPKEEGHARLREPTVESDAVFTIPSGSRAEGAGDEQEAKLGLHASSVAVDQSKDFAECTDEELAAIRKIITSLRVAPPLRSTRRYRRSPRGRVLDIRRMARRAMRHHGEPGELMFRRRRTKQRRLVLILDISGSMADYSRHLLQFAHSVRRGGRNVEVFCFGTRLTRITPALRHRDPDAALRRAGEEVVDWSGGTRIGASINDFVRRYGRRGTARGAIVVICSDGLDRGDPAVLDDAMERLSRLAHRIVWMNPMTGEDDADYVAASLGMSVAMPYVDVLWSGHSLASLVEFADALPGIR